MARENDEKDDHKSKNLGSTILFGMYSDQRFINESKGPKLERILVVQGLKGSMSRKKEVRADCRG